MSVIHHAGTSLARSTHVVFLMQHGTGSLCPERSAQDMASEAGFSELEAAVGGVLEWVCHRRVFGWTANGYSVSEERLQELNEPAAQKLAGKVHSY